MRSARERCGREGATGRGEAWGRGDAAGDGAMRQGRTLLRPPEVGRGAEGLWVQSPSPSFVAVVVAECRPRVATSGRPSPGWRRNGRGTVASHASKRPGGLSRGVSAQGMGGRGKAGEPSRNGANQTSPKIKK
jgi:hypothetical protein